MNKNKYFSRVYQMKTKLENLFGNFWTHKLSLTQLTTDNPFIKV